MSQVAESASIYVEKVQGGVHALRAVREAEGIRV
jgi:hypothetical protein